MRQGGKLSRSVAPLAIRFFASLLLAGIIVSVGCVSLSRVYAAVTPPRILMYQGRLLNSNNVPVSDATASMSFALYDALSGGTCLWSNNSSTCASVTTRSVTLTAGLFSEALGDTGASYAAIQDAVFSNNATVYLEVIVNGETLAPRKRMLAAPYAVNSDFLDGFGTTQTGATIAAIPVFDTNGNLVITGAPQGTGVNQGSLYVNPASGVVATNEILLGVAVDGVARFSIDGEGDAIIGGNIGMSGTSIIGTGALQIQSSGSSPLTLQSGSGVVSTSGDIAVNGGDLTTTSASATLFNSGATTVTAFGAATILDLNNAAVTSTINIGGVSNNGVNTINIATNGTSPDAINLGNNNAGTLISITGGTAWSVATNGNILTAGDVAVNGGDITSTGALNVTSGGSGALVLSSGSGIVSTAGTKSFAVGANSLTAAFSVDASNGNVRFGTGSVNDPLLTFYANDGVNSGTLSFSAGDAFQFSGAQLLHTGLGTLPSNSNGTYINFQTNSTVSGTSGNNLSALKEFGSLSSIAYSAVEGSGTTSHEVNAGQNSLSISGGTSTITFGAGVKGSIFNSSTNANLVESGGFLSGVVGLSTQNASATTVSDVRGVYGETIATNGTIGNAYGVFGTIAAGGGTITSAYGVFGRATNSGTTRYGIYGEAGGGTTNFSGYFSAARVQIDTDSTPDATSLATGPGDLFISSDLEGKGSIAYGDSNSAQSFTFLTGATTTSPVKFGIDKLQSGTGLTVSRGDDGTNFTGTLMLIDQQDNGAGTTGTAMQINQLGTGGTAVGLRIVQATTSAHAANAVGNNALIVDVFENGSADNAIILRSDADNNGTGTDTEFRVTTQGDVYGDGATYNAGADYAEFFLTTESALTDYELVCQDPAASESVRRCTPGSDEYLLGVISTNAAFVGNNNADGSGDVSTNTAYRKVGMVGQIATNVNASEGSIAIGDPITTSATMTGYGAKSVGPHRIIGFALEPLSAGTGTIRVLVQPQWYAGDVLTNAGNATQVAGSFAVAAATTATSTTTAVNSGNLELRGSAWNGSAAQTQTMGLRTTVNAVNDYRLSVTNNDNVEVASINKSGDLSLAGKFYPSDRGAIQGSAYIYYDGSAGIGGSFMRTNASGWATGSYDFAEMFPSRDALAPGELVVFGDESQNVKRSTGETYSRAIMGIVSTRPGFLAGENRAGNYPIALAGRVPTFVSTENGEIHIGDPLTTSSRPGYAMKATEPGPIVGYAAETFTGTTGSIVVYVNVSYYSGAPAEEGPGTDNSISHLAQDIANFDTAGVLNFNGGQLLAIGAMTGANGAWRLDTNGDFVTSGRLVQLVQSSTGSHVETYAATSREMTVQLSGTIELENGRATVTFADIDPAFTSIIDTNPSYRALVTPYGATGSLYVTNRTVNGFDIVESGAASSGVSVDWIVIAYRRDYAPAPVPAVDIVTVPNAVSETSSSGEGASTTTESEDDVVASDGIQDEASAPVDSGVVSEETTIETSAQTDSGSMDSVTMESGSGENAESVGASESSGGDGGSGDVSVAAP